MRVDFSSNKYNVDFNRGNPEVYTEKFRQMRDEKLANKTDNNNEPTQTSQGSNIAQQPGVEIEAKEELSYEVLKEYLEAVAKADSTKASNDKIGYVVIAAAITAVALLALKCSSIAQENILIKSNLKNCQNSLNNPILPESFNSTLSNLEIKETFFGETAKILNSYFKAGVNDSSQASQKTIENCKLVPFSVGDLQIGVQKRCLDKSVYINDDNQIISKLSFSANPHTTSIYNGTSSLYNRINIFCVEKKVLEQDFVNAESNCVGSFTGKATAFSSKNNADVCLNNYFNSEKLQVMLSPNGVSGVHKATEKGIGQETTSTIYFTDSTQLTGNNFEILKSYVTAGDLQEKS
ncbi:MAG: hypothetical protein S4CHLAM6_14970 [Chlamydiae bacterium]|nr:hypothetical protein [Chlamydiota bacterium]